jgi:glycosyltransferase involved in cell wall biosynthesis
MLSRDSKTVPQISDVEFEQIEKKVLEKPLIEARENLNLVGLVFSKDRAMQLEATLDSFSLHCTDFQKADMVVLYRASNNLHHVQYQQLRKKYGKVLFLEERDFKDQVLSAVKPYEYVLFLVDDNIFVRPFSLSDIQSALNREKQAIGFSLRLGVNTNYCYSLSSSQELPSFEEVEIGIMKYSWPGKQCDFGYPLEISSSVYRCSDILPLIEQLQFTNPNQLESAMNHSKSLYDSMPYLLTFENSVTFCNPVNVVQNICKNKFGAVNNYTATELADCFSRGMIIDVEKYIGFTPNAAHQEVPFHFKRDEVKSLGKPEGKVSADLDNKPKFSIIMANYNNEKYIPDALESVLNQTFSDWELIIIDDCSTDDSLAVIEPYLQDRRIRLIRHERNKGYSAALKTGIGNIRSDYFGIFDSDDRLREDALEIMYDSHIKYPECGLIYSQFMCCDESLVPKHIGYCAEVPAGQTNLENYVVSHFKTFKLRDYLKTDGYDDEILYAEDRDICYKMEEVTKLKFVNECLYYYRELLHSHSHEPIKAAIGRWCRQRARLNAYERRGVSRGLSSVQRAELAALNLSAIADGHMLGISCMKAGRYADAGKMFELLLKLLEGLLQHYDAQSLEIKQKHYTEIAERYYDISAKLAQCYLRVNKFDEVEQVYVRLLDNSQIRLTARQRSDIAAVLGRLKNRKVAIESPKSAEDKATTCHKEQPLVSVVMPAYNDEKYIADAIKSVLAQTYGNFELVIINDGSTDRTDDIIYSLGNEKIRYFYQENRGLAATHNEGLRRAFGSLLIKLDSDDMMTPDFIERHVEEFARCPDADLIYCDDRLIRENGDPIRVIKRSEYADRKLLIRDLFCNGFPVIPFRTCIRKRVFEKIGLFNEELRMAEDYDMMRRFVKAGLKAHHLREALYLRRMAEDSLSRRYTEEKARIHFSVWRKYLETFSYDELFPDVQWNGIRPEQRDMHAKCLAAAICIRLGQTYVETNIPLYAQVALENASRQLKNCLGRGSNRQIEQLLGRCEQMRQKLCETCLVNA